MRWEAANVKEREQSKEEGGHDESKRTPTETVEAALARLTRSYSAAMSCIGSLHQLASLEGKEDSLESMQRVADAARSTLEQAVLSDPLIFKLAPTWHSVVQDHHEEEKWSFVQQSNRPPPPVLTSTSHRSTVRELAYLSLVNYADLLVKVSSSPPQNGGILDRGVVAHIPRLSWKDESVEFTQRLALVALCDASELDGSDPTVWLKLACAARRFRTTSGSCQERLERHALERGRTALLPNVPPNRLVMQALAQLQQEEGTYPDKLHTPQTTPSLVIDLPRYSWAILGRILLKACREGSAYRSAHFHSTSLKTPLTFGSPRLTLNLSPMLVLPPTALGTICQYLDNSSVWKFEATCRALSASILSARATMERRQEEQAIRRQQSAEEAPAAPPAERTGTPAATTTASTATTTSGPATNEQTEIAARSHRSSKRVQSQLITSGKLAERKAKRTSVEFCFVAAIFGCETKDEAYQDLLKGPIDWDDTLPSECTFRISSLSPTENSEVKNDQQQPKQVNRSSNMVQTRLGDASLSAFVERSSDENSGPMNVLSRYLTHIAMNVEQVFMADPENTMVLTPCVLECIDALSRRSGCHQGMSPWLGPKPFAADGNKKECMEAIAVNLLNAELRLRRCEGDGFAGNGYDDDGTIVAISVPELLHEISTIKRVHPELFGNCEWGSLEIRIHWLAAGFYLWWSKVVQNISESRQAENRGLEHIDKAIQCLRHGVVETVNTPHLESPSRTDLHWRVLSEASLSAFRDEIQASSVVTSAREEFLKRLGEIEQRVSSEEDASELTKEDKTCLSSIAFNLYARYNVSCESPGRKLEELMDDFFTTSGDMLLEEWDDGLKDLESDNRSWKKSWDLVSSRLPEAKEFLVAPRQSILSILCTCMHAGPDNELALGLLLSRLVLTALEQQGLLTQKTGTSAKSANEAAFGDDDDFSESDDDSSENDEVDQSGRKTDERKVRKYCRIIQFLLDKITDLIDKCLTKEDRTSYARSMECSSVLHFSLGFSAEWYGLCKNKSVVLEYALDLDVLQSTQKLVRSLLGSDIDSNYKRAVESSFFCGLSRILVSQRQAFPSTLRAGGDNRMGRSTRQKVCLNRADFVSLISGEIASMLSRTRVEVRAGRTTVSYLVHALSGAPPEQGRQKGMARLALLCECVLWWWKYMSLQEPAESSTVGSSFDRPIIETLYAPIAAVIVGLCGAATVTNRIMRQQTAASLNNGSDSLCLSEFYDSDASASEVLLGAEDVNMDDPMGSGKTPTELLRAICHAVHCAALISCELNSKVTSYFQSPIMSERQYGPLLPLVFARVCNHFADILLSEFGTEGTPTTSRRKVWATEYPFGARQTGGLLDCTLHKVYRALHGFTLAGNSSQYSIASVEHLTPSAVQDDDNTAKVVPESTLAAAQLYRCIARSYANGRKSPPKAALECVGSALPVIEESERSRVLRKFVFSGDNEYISHTDVISLLTKRADQVRSFHSIPDWVWEKDTGSGDDEGNLDAQDREMEDVWEIRKGICHVLAQGPLPSLSGSSAAEVAKTTKGDVVNAEERIVTARNEEELGKKFNAVLDDLCYGEPVNSKGWYDASQCLLMKADLIADRLGLSKGFSRAVDFQITTNRPQAQTRLTLAELIDEQEKEYDRNLQGWTAHVGQDLSVFVSHQWASFSSLQACFDEVGKSGYRDVVHESRAQDELDEDKNDFASRVWKEIGVLHEKGDYVNWQQAWGGLFVGALRATALRCMCLGMYLLRRNDSTQSSEGFLVPEISESLGTFYYTELMGSQMYGYPMHIMTDHRKRQMAETARCCFQFAVDSLDTCKSEDDDPEKRQTWDLVFMRGKCHEKVASTFKKEKFCDQKLSANDAVKPTRAYEHHMQQALKDYASSYEETRVIVQEGGFPDIHGGGSCHGPTEVLYRLHASRLKCLIHGVSQREEDRDAAEVEALRLTEASWYAPPSNTDGESSGTRDKVWRVLADVVAALAQCRLEQPYFHRSIYRHAQALMWAPVLYDPVSGIAEGSLGCVPATKSYLLRGLNSATPCANSAEAILVPLFEKKRAQLCAVWVTAGCMSQSPFGMLNNSVRKYDSLRGKYLYSYISCLQLCKRKAKLEELLQWTASSARDLPSFFQASALAKGGLPQLPHTKESLLMKGRSLSSLGFLRNLKREANSALAAVILQEVSPGDGKAKDETLKSAYACFLRLNCTVEDLRKTRAWKYGQGSMPEVDALCQSYLARKDHKNVHAEASNWTGGAQKTAVLKAALEKCKELFPTLSSNPYVKRRAKRPAKAKANDSPKPKESRKRKAPDGTSPFVVAVPDGLKAGDKFDTTVEIDGTMKRIRLSVPDGNPKKLQFSLNTSPVEDKSEPA